MHLSAPPKKKKKKTSGLNLFSPHCCAPSTGKRKPLHLRLEFWERRRSPPPMMIRHVEATATVKNYYDILKVEKTATESQIKKAFRRLAVKFHPDKNRSADAEKVFREMAEAYSVLSDKEKRRQYDSMGHEAFLENADTDQEQDTSFHFNFPDIFHDLHEDENEEDLYY
ncbi:hypothetical protein OJAV_G00041590 [Oryzias javanicus]|uniref:DnaJ homolog subfamily B member 9 n=1 Tax=Oryzias javanicus TaxID=123683 RepID=A0A3S2Q7M6_ORYJA|nr:hypothetical protein OJAV_G00041590 [Oryzias javanicus]